MSEIFPLNPPVDWRAQFPFQIGAPSWVYPFVEDNLVANVRYLSEAVDQVQLLFFDSSSVSDMLVPKDLQRLADIGHQTGLAYSIHVPSDLKLLAQDPVSINGHEALSKALDILARIRDEAAILQPRTFILHLDGMDSPHDKVGLQNRVGNVLDYILHRFPDASQWLLLENTNWDFSHCAHLFASKGFGICADFGHVYHSGQSLEAFLQNCGSLIRELHLHGFNASGDHLPLGEMDPLWLEPISNYVRTFKGTVTMELFYADRLWQSLETLQSTIFTSESLHDRPDFKQT